MITNPAFNDAELGDRVVSRRKLKPTFSTQAGALMRKNLVFQKRNWKTNCCLIVSPVVFSVVLAIIQAIINQLFDSENFKCGCQCAVYTTPDGDTWKLQDYYAQGSDLMWPNSIVSNISKKTYNIPSDVTCQQRNASRCGFQYSEPVSITWCPIKTPSRLPPLTPIPTALYRADVPGFVATENETDAESTSTGESVLVTGPNVPVTIPFTGSNRALASQLTTLTINSDTAARGISYFVNFALKDIMTSTLNSTYRDPSKLRFVTQFTQLLAANNNSAVLAGFNAQGKTNLNLVGGVPMLGSARKMPPVLQTDSAYQASQAFVYLMDNCETQTVLNQPADSAILQALANFSRSGGGFGRGNSNTGFGSSASSPSAIPTIRQLLFQLGLAVQGTPFQCVSTNPLWANNSDVINSMIFTGYGKGTPAEQSADVSLNASRIKQYPFAFDFIDTSIIRASPKFSFNLWYNNTDLLTQQGPIRFRRLQGSMNAVTNAFLNALIGPDPANPRPFARMIYLRDMPKDGTQLSLDFASLLGPLFYTWLSQMLLPVMVGLLVYEKEKNLRVMMKMQGLSDLSYWAINYVYYFFIHLAFQLLIWIFGAALQINMFLLTQPGVIIVFYILFTNVQIAIAFLFNAIFSNARSATVVTVVYVIIAGLLGEFLFKSYIESTSFSRQSILGMMILVPFSLYRGYYEMASEAFVGNYVGGLGLTFKKVGEVPQGMGAVFAIFIIEWAILLVLAFYLEQVVSSGSGVKKHPLFFLDCLLKKKGKAEDPHQGDNQGVVDEPDDVRRERDYAENAADKATTPIIAYRLGKTYPGRDGGPPKLACKNFSLAIPKGEVFGLLGPNGAGKSTSINMLIGFLRPSCGTAYVEGYNILEEMDTVYTLLGVCPQHDLLWETLTAREHLLFYGRLKNLKGKELAQAVDEALQSVNLFSNKVGDKRCGGYSGGMKRRLSVAISFIGNPLVVFLDEPSTGLDPASRQQLWGVIKAAKKDRAMVLTTHSMEEAEELCDRLGIFVDGALQCIGNPKELTNRYGGFLILTITTSPNLVENVKRFVNAEISKSAVCSYAVGGIQKFDVPADETDLSSVFRKVEANKGKLKIVDWGVANMTLEEVFIKISRAIGATTKD